MPNVQFINNTKPEKFYYQAAAEEEAKRAEQEMILNFLKDKLEKEQKYSRLNNRKLTGISNFRLKPEMRQNCLQKKILRKVADHNAANEIGRVKTRNRDFVADIRAHHGSKRRRYSTVCKRPRRVRRTKQNRHQGAPEKLAKAYRGTN